MFHGKDVNDEMDSLYKKYSELEWSGSIDGSIFDYVHESKVYLYAAKRPYADMEICTDET